MSHTELLKQVEAHEELAQALQSSARAVWTDFCAAEPALAAELLAAWHEDS